MVSFRPAPSDPPEPSRRSSQAASYFSHLFTKLSHIGEKTHDIQSHSGEPQTHPSLQEDVAGIGKVAIEQTDMFICSGAVDVVKLLRISRAYLLERAINLGANVLVDEQWRCTIKSRQERTFRVNIRYYASATRSQNPDPHRPPALDQAKGIQGLMTIVFREGMSDVSRTSLTRLLSPH